MKFARDDPAYSISKVGICQERWGSRALNLNSTSEVNAVEGKVQAKGQERV